MILVFIYFAGYIATMFLLYAANKKCSDKSLHTEFNFAIGFAVLSWFGFIIYSGVFICVMIQKSDIANKIYNKIKDNFEN